MALGQNTQKFFRNFLKQQENSPSLAKPLEINEFRNSCYQVFANYSQGLPKNIKKEDFIKITLPINTICPANIFIYKPKNIRIPNAAIIFFQGGGFVLNLIEANFAHCAKIAEESGCQIIIIDYPLAPEYSAQQIFDFCNTVTKYIYINSEMFAINKNQFIIAGLSAGGNIAANIINESLINKDMQFAQQILISPWVDISLSIYKSSPYADFQQADVMLDISGMEYLQRNYLKRGEDPKSPIISPYYTMNDSLKDMPPTVIVVAEYDALRGDSEAYYEKLTLLNINVKRIVCEGQTHNYAICRKILNDGIDPADIVAANIISSNIFDC